MVMFHFQTGYVQYIFIDISIDLPLTSPQTGNKQHMIIYRKANELTVGIQSGRKNKNQLIKRKTWSAMIKNKKETLNIDGIEI